MRFVADIESPANLIQQLHHTDQRSEMVDQRQRQTAAGVKSRQAIDIAIETRIGITVRHVDRHLVPGTRADQSNADRKSDVADVARHLQDELTIGFIVQPDRSALRV